MARSGACGLHFRRIIRESGDVRAAKPPGMIRIRTSMTNPAIALSLVWEKACPFDE